MPPAGRRAAPPRTALDFRGRGGEDFCPGGLKRRGAMPVPQLHYMSKGSGQSSLEAKKTAPALNELHKIRFRAKKVRVRAGRF